jgi:prevent-host-death family protein
VKFANVRELKTKTSEILRTVERGNTILVTTHGRPTAMLVPVTEDDIEDALLAYSPTLRKEGLEGQVLQSRMLSSYPFIASNSSLVSRNRHDQPSASSQQRSPLNIDHST